MNSIESKKISIRIRLGAMLLDHFFMCVIAMLFFIPIMVTNFSEIDETLHEQISTKSYSAVFDYIKLFGIALYFCKDIFNGRSMAKRILKLQVVDNITGQAASPLKCLIRNLLCIIWPVEVIAAMINTQRRIGDRIAGTKLVEFEPSLEQPKINTWKTLLPVGVSYGLILLMVQTKSDPKSSKINFSETSLNQEESIRLEKLLTDSLGEYLTPDIRIYDSIQNENIKYISAVLILKENYIGDDNGYSPLNMRTKDFIYSKFPKETFTGQVRYIYRTKGFYNSFTTSIGTFINPKGIDKPKTN